jgi:hypothetical protein
MHQAMSRNSTTILRMVSIKGNLTLWFMRLPLTFLNLTLTLQKIFKFDYSVIKQPALKHQEIASDLLALPDSHSSSVSVRLGVG